MWARLKKLPMFVKIVIACFIGLAIYGAFQPKPRPDHTYYPESTPGPDSGRTEPRYDPESNSNAQLIAQFQAEHDRLSGLATQCEQEMNAAQAQTAINAANGQMPSEPACLQQMEVWTAQMAALEAHIYRLRTGDSRTTVRQIAGIPDSSGSTGGSSSSSAGESDDGTGAVEDWDRGAIRGTTIYTDGAGYTRELPTASYYFHNRETGQDIPSDSPYPPNDGYDYDRLTPQH